MLDWFKTSLPTVTVTLLLAFGGYTILIEQRLSTLEANYKHLETLTKAFDAQVALNHKMDKRLSIMESLILGKNARL